MGSLDSLWCTGDDLLYFDAYAKWGQPPGGGYDQHDFRGKTGWGSRDSLQDFEMTFDQTSDRWQSGVPSAYAYRGN